jgi:hypothetical protein
LETIKRYIAGFTNFQTIGRNGLHRYNNQDHAMLTGMLAVRNIVHNEKNNLWLVNADQEYHETHVSGKEPTTLPDRFPPWPRVLDSGMPVVDDAALGVSLSLIAALATYFITLLLV